MNQLPPLPAKARYFFLSYAPVNPPQERTQVDHWVRRFYVDLTAAIRSSTGARLPNPGFADFTVRAPKDWQTEKRIALGEAEVFVPLYSPEYLDRSESINEREAFRRKLINAGRAPDENILPVLWSPLTASGHRQDLASALATVAHREAYVVNGLSSLCRHRLYRVEYEAVVRELAGRIVQIAEHFPLQLAEPEPEDVQLPAPRPSEVPFLTAVIASGGPVPESAPAALNGYQPARPEGWHPFAGQPPVIRDVTAAVQRLRMPNDVREFVLDEKLFQQCPGLLLIDPYISETAAGVEVVQRAVRCLRNWVGVAVVADGSAPQHWPRGAALTRRVLEMLPATALSYTSPEEWRAGVHGLVDRCRRRYLDEAKVYPPPGPSTGRQRLSDGGPPSDPDLG